VSAQSKDPANIYATMLLQGILPRLFERRLEFPESGEVCQLLIANCQLLVEQHSIPDPAGGCLRI